MSSFKFILKNSAVEKVNFGVKRSIVRKTMNAFFISVFQIIYVLHCDSSKYVNVDIFDYVQKQYTHLIVINKIILN